MVCISIFIGSHKYTWGEPHSWWIRPRMNVPFRLYVTCHLYDTLLVGRSQTERGQLRDRRSDCVILWIQEWAIMWQYGYETSHQLLTMAVWDHVTANNDGRRYLLLHHEWWRTTAEVYEEAYVTIVSHDDVRYASLVSCKLLLELNWTRWTALLVDPASSERFFPGCMSSVRYCGSPFRLHPHTWDDSWLGAKQRVMASCSGLRLGCSVAILT